MVKVFLKERGLSGSAWDRLSCLSVGYRRLKRSFLVGVVLVLVISGAEAQVSTVSSGNWNEPGTWSTGVVPNNVLVQIGHNVAVPAGITAYAAGVDITGGGSLSISSGGIIVSSAELTGTTIGNFTVGGEYQHAMNGGTVPAAAWLTGSTCRISGATTTRPSGLGQTFYHFVWDCAGQASPMFLQGALTNVAGNLVVQNTNGAAANIHFLQLSNASGSCGIGGNLEVRGSAKLTLTSGGVYNVNVGGDLVLESTGGVSPGNNSLILTSNGTVNLTVEGNFIQDATGIFNLGAGAGAVSNLYVKGSFSFLSGAITREVPSIPAAASTIRFSGTGIQSFTSSGYYPNAAPIHFVVESGATLDMGSSSISQNQGTFTSNGTVRFGSPDSQGAIVGNIPLLTKTFSSGSTIVYSGSTQQYMGTAHPSGNGITTRIQNSDGGVSMVSNVVIGGNLELVQGPFSVGNNTLTLGGGLAPNGNTINVLPGSSIVINGSGTFGVLPLSGSASINNLSVNRSAGSVTLSGDRIVEGSLTQTNGDIVLNGHDLVLNGPFARFNGTIIGSEQSSFVVGGAGSLPDVVLLSGSFHQFELNRSGAEFNTSSSITVGTVILRNGLLNNTTQFGIASDGSIHRYANGSMSNTPTSAGLYDIQYHNDTPIFAGPEWSSGTNVVDNVDLIGTGSVGLIGDVVVNGNITMVGADLLAGTSTITLRGNIVSDGKGEFSTSSLIFDGDSELLGTSFPDLGNVQLNADASLTVPESIGVFGDLLLAPTGVFSHSEGTITLKGSSQQEIDAGGHRLYNVTVDQTSGASVRLTGPLPLEHDLEFLSPSELISNGFLSLLSTSDGESGNARIGPLLGGAVVAGNVHVQRYMSDEGRIWRYISSPVATATVADLMDNFPITGPFADPSTGGGIVSGNPSFYLYDESFGTNSLQNGWRTFPASGYASDHSLEVGRGYCAFLRSTADPFQWTLTTWDVLGPVNQGDVSFNGLSFTPTGPEHWNLVGNPYPSSVDWGIPDGWTINDVSSSIAVRDNGTGMHIYWDGELPDDFSGRIATGQAFWVRTTGPSPSIMVHEQAKTTAATFYREAVNEIHYAAITLSNGVIKDKAYFRLRENAQAGLDQYDAPKMENDLFDLSIMSQEVTPVAMAINAVATLSCDGPLSLRTTDMTPGNYSFQLELGGSFRELSWHIMDRYTGVETLVNNDVFSFSVSSDPVSRSADRFSITFREPALDLSVPVSVPQNVCGPDNAIVILDRTQNRSIYHLSVNGEQVGGAGITGNGGQVQFVIPAATLRLGDNEVTVTVNNMCASGALATAIVHKNGSVQHALTEDAKVCFEGQALLSAAAPANGTLHWYSDEVGGQVITSGAEFVTPSISKSRTYWVAVVDEFGCEGDRSPVLASVVRPEPVLIENVEGMLHSNYTTGNQWYFNDVAIENATEASVMITDAGRYRVTVQKDGCTVEDEFEYLISDVNDPSSHKRISVFPNPVVRELTIELPDAASVQRLELHDASGKIVATYTGPFSAAEIVLNLDDYTPGIYLVRIVTARGSATYRLVKS